MLQSFIGTLDAAGIRTLRSEDETTVVVRRVHGVPFWAVLDSSELPSIHAALIRGQRGTALELLLSQARDFGRLAG